MEIMVKKKHFWFSAFGAIVCAATVGFAAQGGAPTERSRIPGHPLGTSLFPTSTSPNPFIILGCVQRNTQSATGTKGSAEFTLTESRGRGGATTGGQPPAIAQKKLEWRLDGDPDLLAFHVGHQVQISGPLVEPETRATPPRLKVESLIYLSMTCW